MNLDSLKKELVRDEGKSNGVYVDSLGFYTIGVGRLVDRRMGGGLSDEEVFTLLDNDIKKTIKALDDKLPWWNTLDEVRQRALANLCFNLGISKLLGFTHFLLAMQKQNYSQAANELVDSLWHKQVGKRAERLESMIRTGEA